MIDIFIKSCAKDFKWLEFCLKSVKKYATGYNKIVLIIPKKDIQEFNKTSIPLLNMDLIAVDEYGDGYLYQQVCKMKAYEYSNADFIMFVDSDCMFYFDINLNDLIKDNKPEILYTPYEKLGDAKCWKKATETFLNKPIEFEFMRRNGLIYHTSTLINISELYPELEKQIMNTKGFSEFNLIGAYAFEYEKEKYNFIHTEENTFGRAVVIQGWTWGDNEFNKKQEMEFTKLLE